MSLNNFDLVWERVKAVTGWKYQKEMAEFLTITKQSISGAKARGVFPINWAVSIARGSRVDADWLMTGSGEPDISQDGASDSRRDFYPDDYSYQDSPESLSSGLAIKFIKEIDQEGDPFLRTTFNYLVHFFYRAIEDYNESKILKIKLKKESEKVEKIQKKLDRYQEIERNHPELFKEID